MEAPAEAGPDASAFDAAEAASDAHAGPDATDAQASADATDGATLGACGFPYVIECYWVVYDPEGGPSSPTWDQAISTSPSGARRRTSSTRGAW